MINYDAMDDVDTFVPLHMREGYKLYFENGISPGSFGQAVIRGDIKDAMSRADHINQHHILTQMNWVQQQLKQEKLK